MSFRPMWTGLVRVAGNMITDFPPRHVQASPSRDTEREQRRPVIALVSELDWRTLISVQTIEDSRLEIFSIFVSIHFVCQN